MLKNIDPLLGPELLHILRAMGHGDTLAIVDANYPATANAKRLVRLDGHSSPRVLDAILSVLPLDLPHYATDAAVLMEPVAPYDPNPPVMQELEATVKKHESDVPVTRMERFAFYQKSLETYAIIATGEERFFGNILLKKGVIGR